MSSSELLMNLETVSQQLLSLVFAVVVVVVAIDLIK
jgi:hypothetical protein